MNQQFFDAIQATIQSIKEAEKHAIENLSGLELTGYRQRVTSDLKKIQSYLSVAIGDSGLGTHDSAPAKVTKMFGRDIVRPASAPAGEKQTAAAEEIDTDAVKDLSTSVPAGAANTVTTSTIPAEAQDLLNRVNKLYPEFSAMSNDVILDSLNDLEIRAIAKKAGLPVTETSPKNIDSKFIDQVKAAIAKKAEIEKTNSNAGAAGASETTDHIVTDEDLINNPELAEKGIKAGDTIQIPTADQVKNSPNTASAPAGEKAANNNSTKDKSSK